MKRIEDMADAEFLRWLANIGRTQNLGRLRRPGIVSERLERIATFLGGANVGDFSENR